MADIGIVGTGISGLHLALALQHRGIATTVYADRSAGEIRAGRLPNTVARFGPTRRREQAIGVDHWDFDAEGWAMFGIQVWIKGDPPLQFRGTPSMPASFVDFRLYLPQLMADYEQRGGRVVAGAPSLDDLRILGERHDLVVVATGGRTLADAFPPVPERSPLRQPGRRLMAGLFRGIRHPDPVGLTFSLSPGAGELFQGPFLSSHGRGANLLFEAIPGGPLEPLTHLRYEDDPAAFDRAVLGALREHAPMAYERVDPPAFGLTGPADLLQGALTPVVRRAWAPLGGGRCALALGDSWILNDPITGQGANLGSQTAWAAAEAIAAAEHFDEAFCTALEDSLWEQARPVVEWTNAMLGPPPPHVIGLLVAAATTQGVADALISGFEEPARQWPRFATAEGADAFLGGFGLSLGAVLGAPPEPGPSAAVSQSAQR